MEKLLRLAWDPVCVSTSGHAVLVDNAGALIDEILPLAALIAPDKLGAEPILSYGQKVSISGLAYLDPTRLCYGKKPLLT